MQPALFLTSTLHDCPHGEAISAVLAAAVAAVEPAAAVQHYMQRQNNYLLIGDKRYDLGQFERVFVVGAGKAGGPMAAAAASILGDRLASGVVVVKDGYRSDSGERVRLLPAGHPVPDERGVAAASEVAALLRDAGTNDLVVALISGGGSALLTLPVAGVTLADMQALTTVLLRSGASINEINALRKHLDVLKGGGIAQLAHPATVTTLILSDVVGSPLDVIASGPTVADPSSFADAWAVLERYSVVDTVPASIRAYLQAGLAGEHVDTPKAGDPVFETAHNVVVGSNQQAAAAALAEAQRHGFNTLLLTTYLQGEAREAGRFLAAIAHELRASGNPLPLPACVVLGGETTVTLRGNGRGGRNQEMALSAAHDLAGLRNALVVTLATDGGDGPTDAAGAVASGATLSRAQDAGLDLGAHLANNDAYPLFAALGDLLLPGPTDTNVNDLAFVFAWE